jgi:hypothetical protein
MASVIHKPMASVNFLSRVGQYGREGGTSGEGREGEEGLLFITAVPNTRVSTVQHLSVLQNETISALRKNWVYEGVRV